MPSITVLELLRILGRQHTYTVLALLNERGPSSFNQLKAKYHIGSKQLIADLRLLIRAGLAWKPGAGVYCISDLGKVVMAALKRMGEAVE